MARATVSLGGTANVSIAVIHPGDRIKIESATGPITRRATTGIVPGQRFPVVWASREDEWEAAREEGREPEAVPWPAEDVRLAE